MKDYNIEDFTVEHYKDLLLVASQRYKFVGYDYSLKSSGYILWRHDVDVSLNRAFRLAEIESNLGLKATYFINIASEFYNIFEKEQHKLLLDIIELGHDIGVHFDSSLYNIKCHSDLSLHLSNQSKLLYSLTGKHCHSFSFHNPRGIDFEFEDHDYAGLVNCYSESFKNNIGYCSDSNGYWRHQRLYDFLQTTTFSSLQVLTHPACWQESSMFHRNRIFNSIYSRAHKCMRLYDNALLNDGRENSSDSPEILTLLEHLPDSKSNLIDFLWNTKNFDLLLFSLKQIFKDLFYSYIFNILSKDFNINKENIQIISTKHNIEIALKVYSKINGLLNPKIVNEIPLKMINEIFTYNFYFSNVSLNDCEKLSKYITQLICIIDNTNSIALSESNCFDKCNNEIQKIFEDL